MSGDTTRARIETQRFHEEHALADLALKGEKFISYIRLLVHISRAVLFPIGMALMGEKVEPPEGPRLYALFAYTLWVFGAWRVLKRLKATDPKRALKRPLATIVIDNAFVVVMGMYPSAFDRQYQDVMTIAGLSVILTYCALRPLRVHVWFGTACAMVAYAAVAVNGQLRLGVELNPVIFLFVQGSLAGLGWLLVRSAQGLTELRLDLRRRENLSRFLPRHVVQQLMTGKEDAIAPVKREATILFSDLRDFTSMSEGMDPQALMRLLDDYFAQMSLVVQAHDGTVGKFIGDGMLAFWNVPLADGAHQTKAVKAALDMRKALVDLNAPRLALGQVPLRIGIGIHTGTVAAGEVGGISETLREYTVIGDAVNLASRVEGLTKQHHCDVLVTDETWAGLNGAYVGQAMGETQVKGREAAVRVWQVKHHVNEAAA